MKDALGTQRLYGAPIVLTLKLAVRGLYITANLFNLQTCTNDDLQFVLIFQKSHLVVFLKIAVLKNFEIFIVKMRWSLFFNNATGFRTAILSKRYSCTGASFRSSRPEVFCKKGVLSPEACNFTKKENLVQVFFPVNFAKFLKIPFSQNTSGRLLLFF